MCEQSDSVPVVTFVGNATQGKHLIKKVGHMDIRSMYAIRLGQMLNDVFPSEEDCTAFSSANITDRTFSVVCNYDEGDVECPIERQEFDYIMDAIDAAMALAGDPRGFSVYLGFDVSANKDEYIEVEHLTQVRHIG